MWLSHSILIIQKKDTVVNLTATFKMEAQLKLSLQSIINKYKLGNCSALFLRLINLKLEINSIGWWRSNHESEIESIIIIIMIIIWIQKEEYN